MLRPGGKGCVAGPAGGAYVARAMRVVAGAAPEAAFARFRASALGQLLRLADRRHFPAIPGQDVNRDCIFEILSRAEIAPALARVQHADGTFQVALLADAVSRARRQLCRVHDVGRGGLPDVIAGRPVTAFASDGCRRPAEE